MREQVLHAGWVVTHLLRSFFEKRHSEELALHLTDEVQKLQAEVDRTRRILAGYGSLLEKCEHNTRGRDWFNLFCVLVLSALILWWIFLRSRDTRAVSKIPAVSLGDTRGSSDSDHQPEPAVAAKRSVGGGPFRPSHFSTRKR